jgi:hypothetical protein
MLQEHRRSGRVHRSRTCYSALRQVVDLPWSDGLESAIAAASARGWVVIVIPKFGKAADAR